MSNPRLPRRHESGFSIHVQVALVHTWFTPADPFTKVNINAIPALDRPGVNGSVSGCATAHVNEGSL